MIDTPSEVVRHLSRHLPDNPHVMVIPRDSREKRCAAWAATHYEIVAYYVAMGTPLDKLHAALAAQPNCYKTVQITEGVIDPTWPVRYKSPETFRPQVRALLALSNE